MGNVWSNDNSDPTGDALRFLANSVSAARDRQLRREELQAKVRTDEKDDRLKNINAVAQLAQAMGPYAGDIGLTEKGVNELGAGMITFEKTSGTKRQQLEGQMNQIKARAENQTELQNMKEEAKIAQLNLTHQMRMKEVMEQVQAGNTRQALSMMMKYATTFGATGAPSEMQAAQEAVKGLGEEPTRELGEVVAKGDTTLLGFKTGEKPVTWSELVDTVGSQPMAEQAISRMQKAKELGDKFPDKQQAIEDLFFQQYPSLKSRVTLWQSTKSKSKANK